MKRTVIILLVVMMLFIIAGCNSTKSNETYITELESTTEGVLEGEKLSVRNPKVEGPTGIETYFNEDVSTLVEDTGYIGEYWETEDGIKMYGEYIICKARYDSNEYHPNLPVGTVIPTTLGVAWVCSNDVDDNMDICVAVTW